MGEPVIRLRHGEVVQIEGWLLKRRAGAGDDDFEEALLEGSVPGSQSTTTRPGAALDQFSVLHSQLTPTGSKLEALLLRRTERKRYFVLTTSTGDKKKGLEPRALLFYCSRKPQYVRSENAAGDFAEDDDDRAAKDAGDVESDLRRLARQAWQQELNHQWIRGRIQLSETTEVVLLDSGEIKVTVPGKTYYVRPADKRPAEAKVTAGQWYSGLRRAIKDIWMWENRRSLGEMHSLSRASSMPEAQECPDTLEGVLASPIFRKHFAQFCEYRHGAENLVFYEKVEEFEAKVDAVFTAKTLGRGKSGKALQPSPKPATGPSGGGLAAGLRRLSSRGMHVPSPLGRSPSSSNASDGGGGGGGGGDAQREAQRDGGAPLPKDVRLLGREIITQHVLEGSPEQVNLSDGNRRAISQAFTERGDRALTPDFFARAKAEVFGLMETNYFLRFYREEMRKTGCFSSLYGKHGVQGYEAVIAHFGLVKTDLSRLISSTNLRLAQVAAQQEILREALSISRDVAVPSLGTTREALVQLYRSDLVRLQGMDEFRRQLDESVVFPLAWLSKAIQIQLDSIITGDTAAIHGVEHARTALDLARRLVQDMQVVQQYQSADDLANPEAESRIKRHALNVATLDQDLEDAKDRIPLGEMAVSRAQQEMEDRLLQSLDQLEALEIHRLESQQRAVRHSLAAELNFFGSIINDAAAVSAAVDKIDPPSDMLDFTEAFKARLGASAAGPRAKSAAAKK